MMEEEKEMHMTNQDYYESSEHSRARTWHRGSSAKGRGENRGSIFLQ